MLKFQKTTVLRIFGITCMYTIMLAGCKQGKENNFQNVIDSIGIVWVPDLREGIFEAGLLNSGGKIILKGETSSKEAKAAILSILSDRRVRFSDSLVLLPDTGSIKKPWGLVNVSVCNIRFYSSYDAEMVTQALMGTPVKLLKNDNGWLLIQTPDMYIGWVDRDAVAEKSEEELQVWKSSVRVFCSVKTGDIYNDSDEKLPVSDIVAGCILEVSGETARHYKVRLPDGRNGFLRQTDAVPFERMIVEGTLSSERLVSTAGSFIGIPYLWGGTSSKGFDCSGFIKTVYYLNGIILPRDASQQFLFGIRIRRSDYPDSLKKGDLLFFGTLERGRPKPTHVAMYIGNSEFIHSSGMVRINSLDSTMANFSRYRRDSFLGIRRIVGADYDHGIQPVLSHSWYK